MTDPQLRPSPILIRLLAAVFDFSAIMVIVLILQNSWTTEQGGERVPTTESNWISLACVIAYFVVFHAVIGQTPGKRACRLVVVSSDESPAGWWRSALRFVVAFGPFAIGPFIADLDRGAIYWLLAVAQVAVPLAVYLPILLRDDRRGAHDLAAGTMVMTTVPPLSELVPRVPPPA